MKWFYSAYYYLLKKFHPLTSIAFEITSACNLSCVHCFLHEKEGINRELSLDTVKEILICLSKYNFRKPYISITGGEPLLHSQIKNLLLFLNKKKYRFSLMTNGVNIDEEWIDFFNSLFFLDKIGISLDGGLKTHEIIRGKETYAKTINAIKLLSEKTDKQITVKTVIHRLNIQYLSEIFDILRNFRLANWHILPILTYNRHNLNILRLENTEIQNTKGILYQLARNSNIRIFFGEEGDILKKQSAIYCLQGITSLCVASNGDILMCPNVPRDNSHIYGNIYTDDIGETWFYGFEKPRKLTSRGCEYYEILS